MVSNDLCYLFGALRDANLDIRPNKNYEIKFGQKDERWLFCISDIIFKLYNKRFNPSNNMLRLCNKKIVNDLVKISGIKSPQSEWSTPLIVKDFTFENIQSYISGFFDAEGGLPINPETAKQKYISFDQKNKSSLSFIRDKLIELDFIPTNLTYTGNVWQFRLTRKKDIIKFCDYIKSRHPSKSLRLRRLILAISP
ncbi:hypothetical protein HYX17_02390 [Candidatus Woesearchaeota archaeon]|nr:hypothetical protein [Candidatus Woesearchaeota archaeon]